MNKVSVIQGQISQNNANIAVLRNGSVVTARVLSKNGDGSYSVSLAGQKINVKSDIPLKTGSVFSAKVSVLGESVKLSLLKENAGSSKILQKFSSEAELSPKISEFLQSLGFEANIESLKIFQFMQQIGMKIDVQSAKKALSKSKEKSDKSEENSQLELLLEKKCIKSDSAQVGAVLSHNQENSGKNNKNQYEQNQNENQANEQNPGENKSLPKNQKIDSELIKSYFDSVDEAALSRKNGLLSAFNSILSSSAEEKPLRHWIVLPFEWDFKNYSGNIKLLFDSDLKKLQKTIIELKNNSENKIFVINYRCGEVDSVKFSSESGGESLLKSMLGEKVKVESCEPGILSGFCPTDEEISFVNGRI